ncbi:MAG TPA: hypothetical protein VGS07_22145 [Thermoanaerobaculia bacterium]|jgi:hypothetical protein|nr:hypothetical protein [Thermoanaerobaculia bacterium]
MTENEAAAQVSVIASEIDTLVRRLRDVHDGLPVSSSEAVMLLDEEDLDVATALRSMIECVLTDRLEPALVEMRKWAAYKPPA